MTKQTIALHLLLPSYPKSHSIPLLSAKFYLNNRLLQHFPPSIQALKYSNSTSNSINCLGHLSTKRQCLPLHQTLDIIALSRKCTLGTGQISCFDSGIITICLNWSIQPRDAARPLTYKTKTTYFFKTKTKTSQAKTKTTFSRPSNY